MNKFCLTIPRRVMEMFLSLFYVKAGEEMDLGCPRSGRSRGFVPPEMDSTDVAKWVVWYS